MNVDQESVRAMLPRHLQPFVAQQHYETYTPRDHAVWRFLLSELRRNLAESAHEVYLEGLQRTGLSGEAIPRIETINERLADIGWRAVVVDGFVPPAIFMEFQAHRVMPIAVDMRTLAHMLYTPAPDIVHESAGHLPFIIDVDYAEFLQRFGELGMHAIANQTDLAVYEAVRQLSVVKEDPESNAADISAAENQLTAANDANSPPSEAALLARLHWWTVEYGLVGKVDDYRIFGAGLLSSLGESTNCIDDEKVAKHTLTVDVIDVGYDITNQQPQLFVTESCRHLSQVLEEFGKRMCVNRGSTSSLETAITAATVNTAVTNAGIQISGKFSEILTDAVGNLTYLKTAGPTQLSYAGEELPGQGVKAHADGFGSPIGSLVAMERCLSSYTVDELKRHGIATDQSVCLEFLSGVTVKGRLTAILRREQKNLLMTFEQCLVTHRDGSVLFDPDWGIFDMAIGETIVSVFGGSADQRAFPMHASPSAIRKSDSSTSEAERALLVAYTQIRQARENDCDDAKLASLIERWHQHPEWLVVFELLELATTLGHESAVTQLKALLNQHRDSGTDDQATLIKHGLQQLS